VQTRDILISFIFSFHDVTSEPQRLPTKKLVHLSNSRVHRHLPEQGNVVIPAHLVRSAGRRRQDGGLEVAARADEAGHVLDDADDGQADLESILGNSFGHNLVLNT
jgi:hypothetical protein